MSAKSMILEVILPKEKVYLITEKEYKKIFKSQYSSLCFFANRYLDNIEMAKDLVQEVFINVWEDKFTFKDKESIKPILYTAVRNRALNILKSSSHKKSINLENFNTIESEVYFMKEVFLVETSSLIERAIITLPKKCAKIMKLCLKGYTNTEIAEELNISVNTIKTQKKIAYQRLRKVLNKNFS